jgi:hypothetical protein
MARPSGDHCGSQSMASSSVSRLASPPVERIVQSSLLPVPLGNPQNTIHLPSGDHCGWTASPA